MYLTSIEIFRSHERLWGFGHRAQNFLCPRWMIGGKISQTGFEVAVPDCERGDPRNCHSQ
jgi:hypothetical protein